MPSTISSDSGRGFDWLYDDYSRQTIPVSRRRRSSSDVKVSEVSSGVKIITYPNGFRRVIGPDGRVIKNVPPSSFSDLVSGVVSSARSLVSPSGSGSGSGSGGPRLSSARSAPFYPDAPLSTKYGMDSSTAFAEEMANTAHQRNVADLRAAGLNPVLGVSGSGASSVSGNAAVYSTIAPPENSAGALSSIGKVAAGIVGLFAPRRANAAKTVLEGLTEILE